MFYRGRTIYSYGNHFPIATIDEKDSNLVWFTSITGRSISTSTHVNYAHSAVSHKELIYVFTPPRERDPYKDKQWQQEQIVEMARQIERIKPSLDAARKPEIYLQKIADIKQNMRKFIDRVGWKVTKPLQKILDALDADSALDFNKQLKAQAERRQVIAKRKLMVKIAKGVELWKSDHTLPLSTIQNIYSLGNTAYVRYNSSTKRIETTKGVEIPVAIAKKFWGYIQGVLAGKETLTDCSYKILDYCVDRIDKDGIKVGCHEVEYKEALSIAKELGWKVN